MIDTTIGCPILGRVPDFPNSSGGALSLRLPNSPLSRSVSGIAAPLMEAGRFYVALPDRQAQRVFPGAHGRPSPAWGFPNDQNGHAACFRGAVNLLQQEARCH